MTMRGLWAALAAMLLLFVGAGTAAADPTTGSSNGQTYAVSAATIKPGGWQVTVGQLSGGDKTVSSAFNDASVASGEYLADLLAGNVADATLKTTANVSFGPKTISQVLTGSYFATGAAHPVDYIATIVIDSRTGKPITLDALFADTQAGLQRLSDQTKVLLPAQPGTRMKSPMPDTPGNAPVAKNFANWIPASGGIEIHFNDGQFFHGTPVITVPWAKLTDVLAPDMKALAQ